MGLKGDAYSTLWKGSGLRLSSSLSRSHTLVLSAVVGMLSERHCLCAGLRRLPPFMAILFVSYVEEQ